MPGKNPKTIRSRQKGGTNQKLVRGKKVTAPRLRKPSASKASKRRTPAIKSDRAKPLVDLGKIWDSLGIAPPIIPLVSFVRPDDLLVCKFTFVNLKLLGGKLVRASPALPATLVVELPPQSFAEQAFLDATGPEVTAASIEADGAFQETSPEPKNVETIYAEVPDRNTLPFAKIRMAGPSRIAFTMPDTQTELDFTATAILDACRQWTMRLNDPTSTFYGPDGTAKPIGELNGDWLAAAMWSPDWVEATQTLIYALGGEGRMQERLEAAAVRIANQAAQALNARQTRGLATALTRAMTQELDNLAADYPHLREGQPRDLAMAALSFASSKAFAASSKAFAASSTTFAASSVPKFNIGDAQYLPFLHTIFAPHKPATTVTALELPYRVILSPTPQANWWHATKPVVHNGRTELWHTRLTKTTSGIGVDPATEVRAIWSPDYPLESSVIIDAVNNLKPFRMSLDALDRQMLVKLMGDDLTQGDSDGNPFVPRAATSQRLMLSALGALLDVEGNWSITPVGVGLEQWRHLATLGRDAYVRVVYKGFLCPFGHSASLIKVTERKFEYQDGTQNRVALLRQRFFLVVREPVKQYNGTGQVSEGRTFPFTSVELLTRVTPNLVAPDDDDSKLGDGTIYEDNPKVPNRACFWPMVGANGINQDFLFPMAATDLSGERVTFAMPLLFVGKEANDPPDPPADSPTGSPALDKILASYDLDDPDDPNTPKSIARRTISLGNITVCYAPMPNALDAKGYQRLPTATMTFAAAGVKGSGPNFCPEVASAEVGIAAIQRLLQKPDAVVTVKYPEAYKDHGFGGKDKDGIVGNTGEVFLKTTQSYGLDFGDALKSDAVGGLATPSMAIQGLSRKTGPVAAKPPDTGQDVAETALDTVSGNTFDPADFFNGAKILGGIALADLLDEALLEGAPKLLSKQLPEKIEASFDWKTDLKTSPGEDPLFVAVGKSSLDMHAVVSSPIADPSATTFNATATLVNFKINLFGIIIIWFDTLSFTSKTGSKPEVVVDLHPGDEAIVFGGDLEFVNQLSQIIPSNGFNDSAASAVTPSGIGADFSLSLPSLAVGIFALENISLGAEFALPFDAKPAQVRFNFAERQSPFTLVVAFLGGGGFFAIGVSAEGVDEIEAALEFGAELSIDLGVASGSVEIKAGVYFHWMTASVKLTGYVRLHGELSILGLISASLTFNLQLTYDKENGRSVVWGEATLTVEVDLLFFSADVSVDCRREFGGSDADPKFIELIPDQKTWETYCNAYAVEA